MKQLVLVVTCAAVLAACGDTGSEWQSKPPPPESNPPPPESIGIEPPVLALGVSQQALLVATFVPGGADTHVTWSATGGTIVPGAASTALFTAPGFSSVVTIRATSFASPSVFGEAVATVTGGIVVTIPPQDAAACVSTQLRADVVGTSSPTVTWTGLDPSCGVVNIVGAFTSARGTGGCPVRACSTVDIGACGEGLVNVLPERILQVSITPATAALGVNATQVFTATVKTSCGDFPAGG